MMISIKTSRHIIHVIVKLKKILLKCYKIIYPLNYLQLEIES